MTGNPFGDALTAGIDHARETTPAAVMTSEEARDFRASHSNRAAQLSRLNRYRLAEISVDLDERQGIQRVYGGPASKDELINAILAVEYPSARLNEASHVLYHKPGETWSACNWCHPHQGAPCECDLRGAS